MSHSSELWLHLLEHWLVESSLLELLELLEWAFSSSELILHAHHHRVELLHLLHHERVHHESSRVHRELSELWFSVSALSILAVVELLFFDVVGDVHLGVEFLDLRVSFGALNGKFGVFLVQKVDESVVRVLVLISEFGL